MKTCALVTGLLLFLLLPPLLFSDKEGWSYEEGFYYSFITLSTIGFGDYVIGELFTFHCFHLQQSQTHDTQSFPLGSLAPIAIPRSDDQYIWQAGEDVISAIAMPPVEEERHCFPLNEWHWSGLSLEWLHQQAGVLWFNRSGCWEHT